ncbi:PREDICTED: DDB1- and CUL4-associated factor homolog 1-like [Erythranthe guttata]|uniref:DDB1- and CUL4-associated factor homolog 1-like n=1 Tax=Erythranthe guttata TaxID=4155 RepID=UPI00064D8BDD|nr:PREDICTED: DDB1- and CUL4-associated factor homolog 1-like [Erythranthe guttata]XP_012847308.1 PREDICTED: DDB1- and CUL4-associated factor homolog 1-like [Erythranthe guttata]|eukprot:XP_012847307.1 PREDICTED: DDB1- and CUL4-associated factor homolog 1-like [Erythranthe guttata]
MFLQQVIINSEVCDLRNFKILRTVPSLHQTTIKFNSDGDVIYAILRRDRSDFKSAVNPRRMKHNLFSAFRTVDALNYTDIATIPIERCVLDFATEPTDSFVGLITMDNDGDMKGSLARIYDVGERNNPSDGDYGLQFNRNRNWNRNQNRNRNRDAEYDLHTVELDEDEEESEGNDYEETVNEDEEYESGSDLSLNIYRSEDEDN